MVTCKNQYNLSIHYVEMMKLYFLIVCLTFIFKLPAIETLHCIILLNQDDTESIGNSPRFYLMSKLQSALAEQASPILVHASQWNSFVERRTSFEQRAALADTRENMVLTLYQKIQERIKHLSDYYNATSDDITQNKSLVAQHINEEFYTTKDKIDVSDEEYQLLLTYITSFDPKDWSIYQKGGFYLFLPKRYRDQHITTGFKLDNLEEVAHPLDSASNYFESQMTQPFTSVLSDFFLTHEDFPNTTMPYAWNFVFSGHGYYESTWTRPCLADLNVQEIRQVLLFFHTQLNTHVFHYSSCYAAGNNIDLMFENNTYNYTIICECLTDCATYCKWKTMLPSPEKKFLTTDDLYYDSTSKSWNLVTKSPYDWGKFFSAISQVDFSEERAIESIERLPDILYHITHPTICNISLLRRPDMRNFYPLSSSDTVKIDDRFITQAKKNLPSGEATIALHAPKILLVESGSIDANLKLESTQKIRVISTRPGKAIHYIKMLTSANHLDIPSVFWQAEYQIYNKIFVIDECVFPHSSASLLYKDVPATEKDIILKNVLIIQQTNFAGRFIRLFFTINDSARMVIATKNDELAEETILKEIAILTPEAKGKYENHCIAMKNIATRT